MTLWGIKQEMDVLRKMTGESLLVQEHLFENLVAQLRQDTIAQVQERADRARMDIP